METGLLEKILTRRYGAPKIGIEEGLRARFWNLHNPDDSSALYVGMTWTEPWTRRYANLRRIYGDAYGGYLIKNAIKAALLTPREVYGIWNIDEFRMQPQVQRALANDPDVQYFYLIAGKLDLSVTHTQ